MDNLVLACYDCNRNKHDYSIPDDYMKKLHPDGDEIKNCFCRDEDYYIKINLNLKNDAVITEFYNMLCLGQEIHRLDYLLMRMMGLQEKHKDEIRFSGKLASAIELLRNKRNINTGN